MAEKQQSANEEQWNAFRELMHEALVKLDDRFALEEFPTLSRLPAIEQEVQRRPHEFLAHGKVLQEYLQEAVELALAEHAQATTIHQQRIAEYLRRRYLDGVNGSAIAREMGLTRSHVVHGIRRCAVDRVTRCFSEVLAVHQRKNRKAG